MPCKRKRLIECSNGNIYVSVAEAARAMGWKKKPILRCLNGSQPSAYGHRWKYIYK